MTGRILVVEDQEPIRALLSTVLTRAGFEVEVADDGAVGLQRAKAKPPAVVLLDLMMPGMHGYELIQNLRAFPGTSRVPIVVLSAKAYASDQRKALDMGASAYVQKPFDTDDIIRLVTSLVHRTTVTFWGVRGSCAAPGPETARYGGNTPCVTIEHEGHILILDAGTGIRKLGMHLMAAAAGRPLELDLLISHTHWDHIQGFPFFVPAYIPGNRVNVYGPRSAEKPLEKVLRGQMDVEYFPVALGDLAARMAFAEYRGQPWQVGPFHVRPGYLNHPGMTLGFRIEVGGLCITYATDTEPFRTLLPNSPGAHRDSGAFGRTQDQALIDLARGADVYIADAQYTPEEYKKKTGWGHTNYEDAVETAVEAGAKHLVLFSHDPMHDDAAVDHKLAECRAMVERRGLSLAVTAASELVPLHLPAPAQR